MDSNLRHAVCQRGPSPVTNTANYIWGNLQKAWRGHSSLHGVLNMLQTYKLQAAQEYIRALTIESHPLHDELQCNNDLAVLRLKRVMPWTKASRDSLVAYNGKTLLVNSVGDRTWRERDKTINAEVSHAIPRAEKGQLLSSLRMAQLDIISLLGVVQCGTTAGEHHVWVVLRFHTALFFVFPFKCYTSNFGCCHDFYF